MPGARLAFEEVVDVLLNVASRSRSCRARCTRGRSRRASISSRDRAPRRRTRARGPASPRWQARQGRLRSCRPARRRRARPFRPSASVRCRELPGAQERRIRLARQLVEAIVEHLEHELVDERASVVRDAILRFPRPLLHDRHGGLGRLRIRRNLVEHFRRAAARGSCDRGGAAVAGFTSGPNSVRIIASIFGGSTSPTTTTAMRSGRYHFV